MLPVVGVLLAVLTTGAVLVAPWAAAEPATRSCPLMVDPREDTGFQGSPAGDDRTLDLVSADIASDPTHLTVVMRVVELRLPPAGSPTGVMYDYGLTIDDREFVLVAKHSTALGESFVLKTRQ